MFTLRPAADRGHLDFGWLDTRHTFSFGEYFDPAHMGFSVLRVINDDRIAPGGGFPLHPHRDMEILTYVLSGALAHQDSMGNASTIRAGEIQRMTAGTGVRHAEANASKTEALRLLQIWILPERPGLTPGYEQADAERSAPGPKLLAAPAPSEGLVSLHQDVRLWAVRLGEGEGATLPLAPGRRAWVQVAEGSLSLGAQAIAEGDGVAVEGETEVALQGRSGGEALVFDLP